MQIRPNNSSPGECNKSVKYAGAYSDALAPGWSLEVTKGARLRPEIETVRSRRRRDRASVDGSLFLLDGGSVIEIERTISEGEGIYEALG